MERRIYVLRDALAVTEDGRLMEYIPLERENSAAEAIILGRVDRVVRGMQAAFVDIGQEKNGFLPLKENSQSFTGPELRDGMHVPVQVKKDAHGGKGAFLTRDISLCGALTLVMPLNRFLGVSSRITEEQDRRELKRLAGEIAGDRFGLVMREASLQAQEEDIRQEAEALYADWLRTAHDAATAHAPSVVYRPRTALQILLDDLIPRGVCEIVSDQPDFTAEGAPVRAVEPGCRQVTDLLTQRDKALQRRVWLDCGANLIIDPCEAMTVIDVNTARFTGNRQLETTLLQADLEAAREAARQIRLRNLSGIILIDMIDLQEEAHRTMVLEALREALSCDRVKTVVHGFTSLGLVEITRKKSRNTLMEACTIPCPHCGGSGRQIKEEPHG